MKFLKVKKVGRASSFYKFFLTPTQVWVEHEICVGNCFIVAIA